MVWSIYCQNAAAAKDSHLSNTTEDTKRQHHAIYKISTHILQNSSYASEKPSKYLLLPTSFPIIPPAINSLGHCHNILLANTHALNLHPHSPHRRCLLARWARLWLGEQSHIGIQLQSLPGLGFLIDLADIISICGAVAIFIVTGLTVVFILSLSEALQAPWCNAALCDRVAAGTVFCGKRVGLFVAVT